MDSHNIHGSYFSLKPTGIKPTTPLPATINAYEESLSDVIKRIIISVKHNDKQNKILPIINDEH